MVNFQMGQFESLKLIFCKIRGQFELEGQGQVHQFLNNQRALSNLYTAQVEGKIPIMV